MTATGRSRPARASLLFFLLICTAAFGLDTLRLQPNERILIIAPHPDDEVIACGGLIQQALELNDSVWVVYLTSGDAAWPSVTEVTHRLFPGPRDYIELGRARMLESRRSMALLGLDSSKLTFLGYPDANLADLWVENWEKPRKSGSTAVASSPYGTGREHTGRNLMADLLLALRNTRPDRVFAPHSCDAHSDHWATAGLLALAREVWARAESLPFPAIYSYLVHRRPFPEAFADESGVLWPPDDLLADRHRWYTLPLSAVQTETKLAAYEQHESQLNLFDEYVYGFIAGNELFDVERAPDSVVTDDAPTLGFLPAAGFDSLGARHRDGLEFWLSAGSDLGETFTCRLITHAVGAAGDSIVVTPSIVEFKPTYDDSREATEWTAHVAPSTTGSTVLFGIEVKWGRRLVNHSGLGRIVY